MSININIFAERKITFKKKNGKRSSEMQSVSFDCWQTPTDVTNLIMASDNPLNAYIDFVRSRSNPEKLPVYAEDDIFGENDPIGYTDYDPAEEHINMLQKWIEEKEENGYTIKLYSI